MKKVLGWLALAFVIWYLLTEPAGAADAVDNAFDGIIDGFDKLGVFFRELFE